MITEIHAPWTPEQIEAINRYQTTAEHPLICSYTRKRHGGWRVTLIARRDGMYCSDRSCDYRQPWAWDFMADPDRAVWGPGWESLLRRAQAQTPGEPAQYTAARADAAKSLRAVEAEAAELGIDPVAELAGWQAGQFELWTPFTAMAGSAFRPHHAPPNVPGACYEASFGLVHVQPGCRCAR